MSAIARFFVLLLAGVLVISQSPSAAVALQSDASATPVAECTAPEMNLDDLLALDIPESIAAPSIDELLNDSPASPEIEAEIAATMTHLFACLNAGEMLRYLSFYTINGLRLVDLSNPALTGDPDPAEVELSGPVVLKDIVYARQLADGRVGAVVISLQDSEGSPPMSTIFVVFAREDGELKIDDVWGI
jgi:hypothetical protein